MSRNTEDMIEESQTAALAGVCPLQRSDLTVHELDGEALVYDPVTASTHRLNDTALLIWQQCDGKHDARQIAAHMADVYDVAFSDALKHTERMFAEFQSQQIVVTIEEFKHARRRHNEPG
ncbi:MAG: PqqD family protein [Phycisphaerales bacterium]|nr:MAG: PqqD family protein [Phycisphaerales bacterium]